MPDPKSRILTFALVAVLFETAFWFLLYFRPTPFGRPFALDPTHYVFHAMYYGAWGHALLAAPFLSWTWLKRSGSWAFGYGLHLFFATLLLVSGVVDRECQRFLGMHASLSWLRTYAALERTPSVIFASLRADQGGAWSSVIELAACLVYPLMAWRLASRLDLSGLGKRSVGALFLLLILVPTVRWNFIAGGTIRLAKIRPAFLFLADAALGDGTRPPSAKKLRKAVRSYQEHQASLDTRHFWRFEEARFPLRKHYVGPVSPPAERRPSFIVLQLETFRAKDMKSMNPALAGRPPTPFLDGLCQTPEGACFQRYLASAVPTVHAFMAIHASLLQHPSRSIPAEATTVELEGFPQLLRQAGYRTMHFTGTDPDWDSQRVWLDRWYDEVHFDPARSDDRAVFRAAVTRIREVARSSEPFLAYLVSVSNHTPFEVPEPAFAEPGTTTIAALHGTMRYTDDVVRELFESLRSEPWFENTIWLITGDHAFDLGDRGGAGSHNNLRHETSWVPLVLFGKDERLPRGISRCVASHLDLAPTILELASVFADNSYMGRSLLDPDCAAGQALILRGDNYAFENATHSLFKGSSRKALAYDADDRLQERPLKSMPPALKKRAAALADAYGTVLTHAVDSHRVVPKAP